MACCALSATATTNTVSVTETGQFRLDFTTTAGGGIEKLYDLVEDPLATLDLAGSDPTTTSSAGVVGNLVRTVLPSWGASGSALMSHVAR